MSYCLIAFFPHTRGKEISIPPDLLLKEAQKLAQNGVKEILLLGQNVNNYGVRFSSELESKYKDINFPKLLSLLSKVNGIERIRFTSPHPLHFDDEFIEEFASNKKVCKSIHIPLQSGSSAILKKMRRGYTKEWYVKRALKMREILPELSISTDIIVGFPSESERDFADTLEVLEAVRFDTMYSFIYSPRPHTLAHSWGDKDAVPKQIAQERLHTLQNRHREILCEIAQGEIGKIYEVLIENTYADEKQVFSEGRSDNNRLLHIEGAKLNIGDFVRVRVTHNDGGSLYGKILD